MNNLYRFLRCAALTILMMTWMMPARAQHPFTLTTASEIANGTQHYYLIQSFDRPTFYAIPHSNTEDSKVSTTSIPNGNMRWYFMDAGSDSDHQYYYIVNSTGRCLYRNDDENDNIRIKNAYADLSSLSDDELNRYKYYLTPTGSDYFIQPKGASNLYLNKRGTNPNYANGYYIKASTYTDSPSVWNFVAVGDVTWPQPFIISTNEEKHCYKFQNVTNTSFYLSKSGEWATVSSTGSNENVWYFLDAGTDAIYSNCHYYYIVNASTGKYLYYTGSTGDDAAKVMGYNSAEADKYRFLIVDAAYKPDNNNYATCYTIVPKQRQTNFSGKDSFAPMAMSDDAHLLLKSDRGSSNYDSHWEIEEAVFVFVEAPTITNNDGTITLSTTTPDATIYYTTNGDTPDNTSTEYVSPFSLGDATVIKAIAYLGSDYSNVTTYNVPQSHDYPQEYLTLDIVTGGTLKWKAEGSNATKTIEYSINNGVWTPITSTTAGVTIDVDAGDYVRLRGTNTQYCNANKNNYSHLADGTATFNIFGNMMSLTAGDNFASVTTLPGAWTFCQFFKQSKCISAENLILPATTLTNDCYRAMFSLCTTLVTAPQLPATTLATECYWYMFEACGITTAPDLLAPTLVNSCYGHMFVGCSNLNYIKCLATNGINATNLNCWVGKKNAETTLGVATTGTFVKNENADWTTVSGTSGIPSSWTINNVYLLNSPEITCDGEYITITCATEGASIFYRLNQTGDFSLYTAPISVNTNTTVEAYSTKDNNTSNTVIITFEIYDNPFDESNRSLDSWTYAGTQVTLPYSVNGIDGHSSNYSKGNHTFEATVTLYKAQPTYLWFQHADQSADIYVDDAFVTTHWGGYNAFFVDITDYVHVGTNRIKVILNNTTRNTLAPAAGDFNFNATLGKAKLYTSPVIPDEFYGYDGFHITSSVTDASATINIKTSVPLGASVVCKIDADEENYHFTETRESTGEEMTFTTTISNPHLWNGIEDPFLYNVTLEIYHNNELYHRFERPYGFRYYEYDTSTGFMLNGEPYLLRGVCMHHDLEGKANALDDSDIANDFAIIQELGCNFVRLAHYPHPKEVYDWCDRLGIIVQTEAPCVNKFQSTMPEEYYTHLGVQYADMVKQHYNHPCILFWGLGNEITTDDAATAKTRLEGYRTQIKNLDPERWVGYVVSHSYSNPSSLFNNPNMDWFGCNIYVGWYINNGTNGTLTNDPTVQLNTRKTNIITNLHKPLAFSEYGCGGTQHCHSEDPQSTTTKGNYARHDIEYQMWLHEGHIAAIKNFPELLFTSQWQLFDIAVSSRNEGYTICLDGENTSIDDDLRYLNNKGLVERDHKTKKDTYYLYKAWWNQTDKFVHICGKDYEKLNGRVIKCYTNDGNTLTLFVNDVEIETVTVVDNIATFAARDFNPSDVIRVNGATAYDAFTFTNDFITDGYWNVAANWNGNSVPATGSDVVIRAECTIPNGVVVQPDHIIIGENGSLTIADGGQLVSNSAVNATVEKNIEAYTVIQNQGELLTDGWYFIASPLNYALTPTDVDGMITDDLGGGANAGTATYDLYRFDQAQELEWINYRQEPFNLVPGQGYLYANSAPTTLSFTGALKPYASSESVSVNTGWNLIGNPFTYNVYANRSFYKMNEAKTGVEAVSAFSESPIAPCTGIVVEAETNGNVIFSKEAPSQSQGSKGSLQLALSQANTRDNALIDNAIVSFNEGDQLGKFYFGTQNANIYLPQGAEEYAIVNVDRDGVYTVSTETPVNFKAKKNGTYTIAVHLDGVEMSYLHLIDNMTGADLDLLQTPEYAFNAKTTDYASRFKLVFVCGDANDDDDPSTGSGVFAFINNGNIIITTDVEGATLQVIDVMGHIVVSVDGRTRCVPISGMTPGMYVLRLIKGDNVMTQKIVIR